jgi:hypothetical protein
VTDKLPDWRRWQGWRESVYAEARVVERCGYCDFQTAGPLEEARAAFEQHQCDRPRPVASKRRGERVPAQVMG